MNPRATLAEIATAAGVGRATLHRHFTSRDHLIDSLATHALDESDRACSDIDYYGQPASVSLRETIDAVVKLGGRYAFLAYQPVSDRDDTKIGERLRKQKSAMRELIEAARAEGMFAKDIPVAWLTVTVDALCYAGWEACSRGELAPNDISDLILRTLENGLRAP